MITTSLQQAFTDVQKLVEKFEKGKDHYMSPTYSESEARQDFIDDFFIALGWDVTHKHQHNPYQQEVKIERSQKQQNESARKRADYAFFLAPNFKDVHFFVEAKKPSVLLHNMPAHYFQTIKYGWNAGCPISILTDFEEFVIIDCRSKPNIKYALNGKHKSYRYTDYADIDKFAEIYYLFSKEAVANKSIDEYAKQLPKASGRVTQKQLFKGGYQAIDDSFLEYIDGIRETIAKAFKKADEHLDSEQLTEATQRTIDRLVFIRFLEDKYIEPINHINEWAASAHPWKAFIADCKTLNAKYNGVVFKPLFIDKDNFLGADEKLFGEICNDLSSDNSPYDFNYIPIHILGSIYERFLGKVVVATAKRVTIEEKPEVRKAGGVFYTPKYIVDYIVANTVGKLIEGKTPAKIAEMTFADIACGSGSFLIGVYDYLLQYHKDYYAKYPSVAEKDGCAKIDGAWILSIKQKQNILLNNIYGVDIDHQAVEVTQLSLFLKMLEDETLTSTMAQAKQTSLYTKVLPDLTKNIVCGNSLIGTDILEGQLFDMAEERKLNPMDYDTTFPKVFKNGGFDAIVGNPPYRTLLLGKKQESVNNSEIEYYKNKYPNSSNYKINLFALFIEKCNLLLNKNSLFSYIIPSAINQSFQFNQIRKFIVDEYSINTIVDLRYKVFEEAETGGNTIFIFGKQLTNKNYEVIISKSLDEFLKPSISLTNISELKKIEGNVFIIEKGYNLIFNKINSNKKCSPLGSITKIYQGIITGDNKKFLSEKKESKEWHKIIRGKDIEKYGLKFNNNYIHYVPKELWSNTDINMFKTEEKIISRQTSDKIIATIDTEEYFTLDSTHVIHLKLLTISLKYLLAIYNSKLFNYLYQNRVKEIGRVFAQVKTVNIKPIPIYIADLSKKEDKTLHDQLVSLVEQMLEAKQKLQTLTLERDIDYCEKKCTTLERQIDNLVYKLYELTEEEIKIIENQ